MLLKISLYIRYLCNITTFLHKSKARVFLFICLTGFFLKIWLGGNKNKCQKMLHWENKIFRRNYFIFYTFFKTPI